MESCRILFDEIDWQSPQPGVRFKAARDGAKQLRLVEFTQEFSEHEWCEKGHAGLVLSGELEVHFISGQVVRFSEGSALLISGGELQAHKARDLTPLVRLFLVEHSPG